MERCETRDWSVLPSDLLFSVAEHLRLADIARLPAVCCGWAWALGRVRKGWPPPPTCRAAFVPLANSSPWLLLPNEDGDEAEYCDFLRLSKIQNGVPRIRISPLPAMAGRICVGGSPDGWIVTVDIWLCPRILNPLTGEEFLLPSLCTLPKYKKTTPIYSQDEDGFICKVDFRFPVYGVSFERFKYSNVKKIILSSAPPLGIAFLIYAPGGRSFFAMARVGDPAWTPALDRQKYPFDVIGDVVYNERDDKFYALSQIDRILVIDLKNYHWGSYQPPETTLLSDRCHQKFLSGAKYIAFSSDGDLLLIWRQYKSYSLNNISYLLEEPNNDRDTDRSPIVREETIYIKILKFDPGHYDGQNLSSYWVHVTDLGDDAMFLGLNHSTCVTTSDKPWLKRNSVYFSEDTLFATHAHRFCTCDGGIFDLKDNNIERFFPGYSKVNWPPPAWFMPSRLQFIL